MGMETKLLYLMIAGWVLMIFVPSILPAIFLAAGVGVSAGYVVFLGASEKAILSDIIIAVAPSTAGAVLIAWPFGKLFRWMLRKKRTI